MVKRKTHRCVVLGCKIEENDGKLSYHEYPSNVALREKWKQIIKIQGNKTGTLWEPPDYAKICSKHFNLSEFKSNTKLRILLPTAIPTIFTSYPEHLEPNLGSGSTRRVIIKNVSPSKKRKLQVDKSTNDVTWIASNFCQVNIEVDAVNTISQPTSSKADESSSTSEQNNINTLIENRLPYNTVLRKVEPPQKFDFTIKNREQNLLFPENHTSYALQVTALENSTTENILHVAPKNNCTVKMMPIKKIVMKTALNKETEKNSINSSLFKNTGKLSSKNSSTSKEMSIESIYISETPTILKATLERTTSEDNSVSSVQETEEATTENVGLKTTTSKILTSPKNPSKLKKIINNSLSPSMPKKKQQKLVTLPENNSNLKKIGENSQSTSGEFSVDNEQSVSCSNNNASIGIQVDSYSMEIQKLHMKVKMLQKQNIFLKKQNNKQCKELVHEKQKSESLKIKMEKCNKEHSVLKSIKLSASEKSPMGSYLNDLIRSFNLKRPVWSETSIKNCAAWKQESPLSYRKARSMQFIKTPSKTTLESYIRTNKIINTELGNVNIKIKKQVIRKKTEKKKNKIIDLDTEMLLTLPTSNQNQVIHELSINYNVDII